MTGIDTIRLADVLPRVFVGEEAASFRHSGIWTANTALNRGETYCIKASSGTGKTSLCSFLMGVRNDYVGEITFNGTDIRSFSVAQWSEIRRSHIAYLPQELELFEELTAVDNVMLKNRLTDCRSEAEIRRMFETLEIDNRYHVPVGRMSVGQRQRVALIRALCQPFDFILLDEPVSHLDEANNRLCGRMIADAAADIGAGIIFTSVGNQLIIDTNVKSITL